MNVFFVEKRKKNESLLSLSTMSMDSRGSGFISRDQWPSKIFYAWFLQFTDSQICTCQSLSLLSIRHSIRVAIVTEKNMFVSCHFFHVCAKRIWIYSRIGINHIDGKRLDLFKIFVGSDLCMFYGNCNLYAVQIVSKRDH